MTKTVIRSPEPDAIREAASILRRGGLVGMPTETVYGLAGDATNPRAVAGIFAAKERPAFNPLIIHVGSLAVARTIALFEADALRLAATFWPGPLTLVLNRLDQAPIADLAMAGLSSIAIRIPAHPVAQALLGAFGGPLAAPSANPSGRISATEASHVARGLTGKVDIILDAGPSALGLESTIIGFTGGPARLLRQGAIPEEAIQSVIGPLAPPEPGKTEAPGMLLRHYAPLRPLRLNARDVAPDEALLAFGPIPLSGPLSGAVQMLNLSARGDLSEAAANLFSFLHRLDQAPIRKIAVMPIPETGLGCAINDRLRRAAVG